MTLQLPPNKLQTQELLEKVQNKGQRIRIAQFGLGMIGIESIRLAATKPWAQVVAGVDIDPQKCGLPLSAHTGVKTLEDAAVYSSFEQMMEQVQPDVILHTAGSKAGQTFDQIEPMIRAGINVISSCEELLYPYLREPVRSAEIDSLCRQYGSAVLGTGVNPGFVMDTLPVCLTGVSRRVDSIYVERVVNASTRRMALQKKIGSSMNPDDFRALFKAGKAGHAGFKESAALICHAMGWRAERITETCEPMIADHDIQTDYFAVKKGLTCGLHQVVEAHVGSRVPLLMDLKMYLDAANPHDAIKVAGEPMLDMVLQGGVAGDHATVAAVINAIPRLNAAGPGLHLMTDLAVPSWC